MAKRGALEQNFKHTIVDAKLDYKTPMRLAWRMPVLFGAQ